MGDWGQNFRIQKHISQYYKTDFQKFTMTEQNHYGTGFTEIFEYELTILPNIKKVGQSWIQNYDPIAY